MRQVTRKRRLGLAAVAGVLAVGVFAADAAGITAVALVGTTLSVAVPEGTTGDHKFLVEPFREPGGRDGWRVGSAPIGAPAIRTADSDCSFNPLFNDVVCNGPRTALAISTLGGADDVVVRDTQHDALSGACITGAQYALEAIVNLGGGADHLTANNNRGCDSGAFEFGFSFHFVANGGNGNDTISATRGPDSLNGGPNRDTLQGNNGADTIVGGSGDDEISGGFGRDTLRGEGGRDILNSRDGERDLLVDCGANDAGAIDTAIVDSGDVGATTALFLPGQGSVIRNCEFEIVIANPIDDGPPGTLLGKRLRIREDGVTRVRIACRRAALVPCRGRVSVRDPKHLRRALASAPYAIRLGARKRVILKLTSAERALLRRRGRAVVTTKEKGRSSRGPRGMQRTLGIAGS